MKHSESSICKEESKESNLVTSSIMLVNNPSTGQTGYYYGSDPRYVMYVPGQASFEDDMYGTFSDRNTLGVSHTPRYRESVASFAADCSCKSVPIQDTFLHQILMGKGYKNDVLFINRPMKQEFGYRDYGCCYGYPYGYGAYPAYH